MMRVSLRPAFINRLIVLMVLIAPIVYFFGVYLAYLAGAHGSADIDGAFASMFPSGNFLEAIGTDVLSNSPVGFVPFADLLKFFDTNLFHFSSNQLGLMAYGYFYYAGHVLLIDLIFFACTFFIRFIKWIVDRFMKGF